MRAFAIIALAIALVALVAGAAHGQPAPICAPRVDLTERLSQAPYHETLAGYGRLIAGVAVMELWVGSGTWTILVSYPDGRSCVVAGGQDWEPVFVRRGTES